MTKNQLATLKADTLEWFAKAAGKGQTFTSYECCHCKKKITTPKPKKSEVTSKGYWDGMKTCYECGKPSYVRTFPNGKTEVVNPLTVTA